MGVHWMNSNHTYDFEREWERLQEDMVAVRHLLDRLSKTDPSNLTEYIGNKSLKGDNYSTGTH